MDCERAMKGFLKRTSSAPASQAPPARTGIYRTSVVGAGWANKGEEHWPIVEVVERETLGRMSRVRVLAVSGAPRSYHGAIRDLVGEWIPTADVVWRASRSEAESALPEFPERQGATG